jgi:hypothetical protein
MATHEPQAELHTEFSAPDATAIPWSEAQAVLEKAEIFWLSTTRADGRPHATPLIAVWLDGVLHFTTGAGEQKARNLAGNPNVILTTGSNTLHAGVDVVLEGSVRQVTDDALLRRLADAWEAKYGSEWHFDVHDGEFHHEAGSALVFAVPPSKAFSYGRDGTYSATRYRF